MKCSTLPPTSIHTHTQTQTNKHIHTYIYTLTVVNAVNDHVFIIGLARHYIVALMAVGPVIKDDRQVED